MGGIGSSADNALAESLNAALKREVLQDANCWTDAATCRREVFRWLALPLFQPRRLRKDPHTRFAARSRITNNPCPLPGVKARVCRASRSTKSSTPSVACDKTDDDN